MAKEDIRPGLRALADLLDEMREGPWPELACWTLMPVYVTVSDEDTELARATVRELLGSLADVTVTVTPGVGPFEFSAEGTLQGLRVCVLAHLAVCEEAGLVPVQVMQPRYTFDGTPVTVAP